MESDKEQVRGTLPDSSERIDVPLDLRCITSTNRQEPKDSDSEHSDQTEISSMTSSQNSGTVPTDFIQDMIDKIDLELTDEQKQDVKRLLEKNREVFSMSEFDLGRTNLVRHKIYTGTNRPFKQQLRRHPMAYLPVIDEHVDKMLANDILQTLSQSMGVECRPGQNVRRNSQVLRVLSPAE